MAWGTSAGEHFLASNPPSATQPTPGTLVRFEKVQPAKVGAAPFQTVLNSSIFNGVDDPFFAIGYNAEKAAGGVGVAAEPSLYFGLESSYNDGVNLLMEWYVNYNSPDNSTVLNFRPIGGQVLRNTPSDWEAHTVFDIGHGAGAFLNIQTDPAAALLWQFLPTQSVAYMPLVLTRQDTLSQAQLKLNTRLGDASIIFQDNGGFNWQYTMVHNVGTLRLNDMVNARDQVIYTKGASAAAATTEFSSRVKIDSFGAFAASDKYVIADASGNLHLSATGPAS